MANFVLSRARQMFSYSDLDGSNNNTSMTITADTTSSLESANGVNEIPKQRRRKCIVVSTFCFGLMVIIVIAVNANHHHSNMEKARRLFKVRLQCDVGKNCASPNLTT